MTSDSNHPAPLLDVHAHLQDPAFDADRATVLRRAEAAEVRRIVCAGTCEDDWAAVVELARADRRIIPALGLHPWFVNDHSPEWLDRLQCLLDRVPSAVGEIGLDRWVRDRDEAVQENVFRMQWDIACQRGLAMIVHCLRAWGWLLEVLRTEKTSPAGFVLHAYGGSAEQVPELAKMGAYFSVGTSILDPSRKRLRQAVAAVPSERLLLETDSPFLPPPASHRPAELITIEGSCRNEPCMLPSILAEVARVRGETEESVRQTIWQNGQRLLGNLLANI